MSDTLRTPETVSILWSCARLAESCQELPSDFISNIKFQTNLQEEQIQDYKYLEFALLVNLLLSRMI